MQAHCTFLEPPSLSQVAKFDTAIAHCPLSNAYFSAQPFRLREALQLGIKVGLGTDIAGGYDIDIMGCMRQAVAVSRMREGTRILTSTDGKEDKSARLAVDWKEALYLATRGGAIALGLPSGCGTFSVGAPFDAQCSGSDGWVKNFTRAHIFNLQSASSIEILKMALAHLTSSIFIMGERS